MKQTIIYLRTSTEEQNPENQLKDCEGLARRLNLNDYEVLQEKQSAFKDNIKREVFDQIKKQIREGNVKCLIVWDFDRIYRNRIKFVNFIKDYSKIGLKVYSVRQSWFESIKNIPEPFNEMMFDLMLQIIGWIAEEESNKKSERTKNAVRRETGITQSYKGNKWGRKSLSKDVIEQIKKLRQENKSISEICKEVYYWDKSNNKKFVSRAVVHKIIKQNKI